MTKKICRSNGSVPTPRRSYNVPSMLARSFFRGRADRSLTARTFSPATPRGPFPPTDPQIAAIDYPRRALFPGEHRRPRFHAAHKADRRDLRLARGAGPCRCGRLWRWRDALFEGPFGQVQDGPSCGAKPATGPCGFTSLEQERPSAFDLHFLVCAATPRPPFISATLFVRWCRKAKKGYVQGSARNTVRSDRRP